MEHSTLFTLLGILVVTAPAALFALLGLTSLIDRRLNEPLISRCTQVAVVTGLLAAVASLGMMLVTGVRTVPIELGNWVVIPETHFHFTLKFVFDRLSVPFVILSFVLVGT